MADPLGGVHILFLRQTTPTSGFGAPGGRIRSGVTRVKGVCEQHGPGLPWGLAPEIPAPGGARAYPGRPAPLPPIPRGAIAGHTVLFPPADPFTNPAAWRLHAGSPAGGDPVAQNLLWNVAGREKTGSTESRGASAGRGRSPSRGRGRPRRPIASLALRCSCQNNRNREGCACNSFCGNSNVLLPA